MPAPELIVRRVKGRHGKGALRSHNAVVSVHEVGRIYLIRIDDAASPEAWLEMTVEVDSAAAPGVLPAIAALPHTA